MRKKNKYGAKKAQAFGRTFDSQGERSRAVVLMRYQDLNLIRNVTFQRPYKLSVNGVHICKYIADFVYEKQDKNGDWFEVVEDFKGVTTPYTKLKLKLMKACLDIDVRIVRNPRATI